MLYAIISRDVENSLELRKSARTEHIARLKELKEQGRLVIAGPFPAIDSIEPGDAGVTGSLVVAEFKNLGEAEHWANEDAFVKAGVYDQVIVKPYKKVLP